MMKTWVTALSAVALCASFHAGLLAASQAEKTSKYQKKRDKIDENAAQSLKRLFEESDKAQRLYDRAVAYAVFDNTKVSLGLTGGGGAGVAVDKKTGNRTYMKMGTAGLNLGLGAQVYQIVFLFEDRQTFDDFVNKGWAADASANAVAGTAGANAETNFTKGMAVYQLTQGGLMLQADISGTKYWKYKKLN
jgi:lipid-binding SYLF domain-containing protein